MSNKEELNKQTENKTVSKIVRGDKDHPRNRTMMQYFEWYLPEDSGHWKRAAQQAAHLGQTGINMVWLPPAYKAQAGVSDVGYGVYDLYDLGEFDQKGTVPTKYGTKDEYLAAIKAMHKAGIEVLGDMVFNHMMGADETENVQAFKVDSANRVSQIGPVQEIKADTRFTFPGRNGKYSDFQWSAEYFDGVDIDRNNDDHGVFLFADKNWDSEVDDENVNFDYLMGADLSLQNETVREQLKKYGEWYTDLTGVDGYRLDAVKHISADFYQQWLKQMRSHTGKEMFAVGEYWNGDPGKLQWYIQQTEGEMSLFDVPLHFKFYNMSHGNSEFPMSQLMTDTLTQADSWHSVTFVDNHDTQPGQGLSSWVEPWAKPLAYALILLQDKGIPCIFYGDYYGIPHDNIEPVKELDTLIGLRRDKAYGPQHDYFDDDHIVGITREGEAEGEGLALLMSDGDGGTKTMYVGKNHAGQTFVDALGRCADSVVIDEEGNGLFETTGGNVSVWVEK